MACFTSKNNIYKKKTHFFLDYMQITVQQSIVLCFNLLFGQRKAHNDLPNSRNNKYIPVMTFFTQNL